MAGAAHLVTELWLWLRLTGVQLASLNLLQQRADTEVGPESLHVVVLGDVEAGHQVNQSVHCLNGGGSSPGQPVVSTVLVSGHLVLDDWELQVGVQHAGHHHLPSLVESVEGRVSETLSDDAGVQVVKGNVAQYRTGHLLLSIKIINQSVSQ